MILLFLFLLFINQKIENKLESSISKILEFEEIEIGVLGNNLLLKNPKMGFRGKILQLQK